MRLRCVLLPLLALIGAGCEQTPVPSAAIPPNDPRYQGAYQQPKPINPDAPAAYPGQPDGVQPPPPPMPGGPVPQPPGN